MPRKSPNKVLLATDEKKLLQAIARKYTSPYRDVMRAKIILLAAEGISNKEIGQRLDLPRQIVSKWRKRFFEQRLAGLSRAAKARETGLFSPLKLLLPSKLSHVSCQSNLDFLSPSSLTMKSLTKPPSRDLLPLSAGKQSGDGSARMPFVPGAIEAGFGPGILILSKKLLKFLICIKGAGTASPWAVMISLYPRMKKPAFRPGIGWYPSPPRRPDATDVLSMNMNVRGLWLTWQLGTYAEQKFSVCAKPAPELTLFMIWSILL
jgi:transposase-like protein